MHTVVVGPRAKREIKKLAKQDQRRIIRKMEALANDPRPHGVEKLSQSPRFWRIRVGDYRIIYAIEPDKEIVVILIIRHRRDAYRDVATLEAALSSLDLTTLVSAHLE